MENNEQFKPLSCGDMDGLLCLRSHLATRYLGLRQVSPEMQYGIDLHNIAHVANAARMRDFDPDLKFLIPFIAAKGEEEFNALAAPYGVVANEFRGIPFEMKGFAEMSLEWFLERTHGSVPLDAERPTPIKIGAYQWLFKPDCLRQSPDGTLIVDDYKTGYIPDKEEVRHTPRVMVYALAASRVYGVQKVQSILWNVSQQFSVVMDWDYDELSRIEKYMQKDVADVASMHLVLQELPQENWAEGLDDDGSFPAKINPWCRSCPVKSTCILHGRLIGEGIFQQAASLTERVKQAKAAYAVVDKTKKELESSLKAEVLTNGDHIMLENSEHELVPAMSLVLGDGFEAVFKSEEREQKEISVPALERFVATHGEQGKTPDTVGTVTLTHGRVEAVLSVSTAEYEELKEQVKHSTTKKLIVRREGPCTGKRKVSGAAASVTPNTSESAKTGSKPVAGPKAASGSASGAGKSVMLSAHVQVGGSVTRAGGSQSDTASPAAPTPSTDATPATSKTSAGPATGKKRGRPVGAKSATQPQSPAPAKPEGPKLLTSDEFQALYRAQIFPSREAAMAEAVKVKVQGDTVEVFSIGGTHAIMLGTAYNALSHLLPQGAKAEKEQGK